MPFASLSHKGNANFPCIRIDGADGYIELIDHIYKNGFRHFAFVGGPANLVNHVERLGWFRQAMRHHKIVLDEKMIVSGDLSSSSGYQAAVELLSLPDPPMQYCASTTRPPLVFFTLLTIAAWRSAGSLPSPASRECRMQSILNRLLPPWIFQYSISPGC